MVNASISIKRGNPIVPRSSANRIKNMLQCRRRNTESNRTVLWADLNDPGCYYCNKWKEEGFWYTKKNIIESKQVIDLGGSTQGWSRGPRAFTGSSTSSFFIFMAVTLYSRSVGRSDMPACVWMWLTVFFDQTAIGTHPGTRYESRVFPFVKPLHFGTTFWVSTSGMLDVRHKRCIQLTDG